jgi:hypothetical protein
VRATVVVPTPTRSVIVTRSGVPWRIRRGFVQSKKVVPVVPTNEDSVSRARHRRRPARETVARPDRGPFKQRLCRLSEAAAENYFLLTSRCCLSPTGPTSLPPAGRNSTSALRPSTAPLDLTSLGGKPLCLFVGEVKLEFVSSTIRGRELHRPRLFFRNFFAAQVTGNPNHRASRHFTLLTWGLLQA